MITLKEIDDMVCETGTILQGDVEVFEGTVRWIERRIRWGKYENDVDTECGYEFQSINDENVDLDNISEYLRKYIEHQLLMEELTIEIINK